MSSLVYDFSLSIEDQDPSLSSYFAENASGFQICDQEQDNSDPPIIRRTCVRYNCTSLNWVDGEESGTGVYVEKRFLYRYPIGHKQQLLPESETIEVFKLS